MFVGRKQREVWGEGGDEMNNWAVNGSNLIMIE